MSSIHQAALDRYRRGDVQGALDLVESAASLDPADLEASHLKAMFLGALGRTAEASAAFELAAQRHPNPAAVLSNYGNMLWRSGRPDQAEAVYRAAIDKDPRLANAKFNLGLILLERGAVEGAEGALRGALALDPRHAGAWSALGAVYIEREMPEEALRNLDRASSIDPGHHRTQVRRAKALAQLGRFDGALETVSPLAHAPRPSLDAVHQLGVVLRMMNRPSEALLAFARARAVFPRDLGILRDFARLLWETGDAAGFATEIEPSTDDSPKSLAVKGDLAFRAAGLDIASRAAEALLAKNPHDSAGLELFSRIHRSKGDTAQATSFARRAHQSAPEDWAIRHQYAECLLSERRFEEAAAILKCVAPQAHLQKQLALLALALRGLNDAGYRRLYDFDRLTRQIEVGPPKGYATIAEFNAAFGAFILSLHKTTAQPIDQTLFGGTQSFGRLWARPEPIVASFREAMLLAARSYVEMLPEDPSHEFLSRKSKMLACAGAWSVVLHSGGGHVDHIHPAGWISASYYVSAPNEALAAGRDGHLRLGASGVAGLAFPAERYFPPIPGTVVFFPSYIWHGVETFHAAVPRITAPFDLVPVGAP